MPMTIKQAAERSGCTAPTIRYYESIGLLSPVRRTAAGRRVYGWPEVSRLLFIRRARDCGMGIPQVRKLLAATLRPAQSCAPSAALIEDHLRVLRERRAQLLQLEELLRGMLDRCRSGCGISGEDPCSILDELSAA
jgi:DNA-binding transcriptional MerR regulator